MDHNRIVRVLAALGFELQRTLAETTRGDAILVTRSSGLDAATAQREASLLLLLPRRAAQAAAPLRPGSRLQVGWSRQTAPRVREVIELAQGGQGVLLELRREPADLEQMAARWLPLVFPPQQETPPSPAAAPPTDEQAAAAAELPTARLDGSDSPSPLDVASLFAAALSGGGSPADSGKPRSGPTAKRGGRRNPSSPRLRVQAPLPTPVTPATPFLITLVCRNGAYPGRRYPLSHDQVDLGRSDPAAGITPRVDLTEQFAGRSRCSVSRLHAEIIRMGHSYAVLDLNSRNGTQVNGRPLEPESPHPLEPGDRLELGDLVFDVLPDAGAGSREPDRG